MNSDREYCHRRAAAELAMARRATTPEAVQAHAALANLYLTRLREDPFEPASDSGPNAGRG